MKKIKDTLFVEANYFSNLDNGMGFFEISLHSCPVQQIEIEGVITA